MFVVMHSILLHTHNEWNSSKTKGGEKLFTDYWEIYMFFFS